MCANLVVHGAAGDSVGATTVLNAALHSLSAVASGASLEEDKKFSGVTNPLRNYTVHGVPTGRTASVCPPPRRTQATGAAEPLAQCSESQRGAPHPWWVGQWWWPLLLLTFSRCWFSSRHWGYIIFIVDFSLLNVCITICWGFCFVALM